MPVGGGDRRAVWLVAVGNLAVFLALFGPALWRPQTPAYRDGEHFYYPLFEYVQREWRAGRIPLWDPDTNCGTPLLANATSSVLYPGKLIFALPIPYVWAYKLYVLSHVVLAGAAMFWAARKFGMSVLAAGMAALSFAFCGNVLFQYSNVVFLCGAAWLPVALAAGHAMLETHRIAWALALGAVLALMVLAGDPQMTYQAGGMIALAAGLRWRQQRRPGNSGTEPAAPPLLQRSSALLAIAATAAFCLSAVQVLPTLELSGRSVRARSEVPTTIYEIPAYLRRQFEPLPRPDTGQPPHWYDALAGDYPPPAKHAMQTYGFSVAPWRLAEFLWPNVSGVPDTAHTHQRWIQAAGLEREMWNPSLYMGLLPCVLALTCWSLRTADPLRRWWSWMVLLCVLASFGEYGPNWLLRTLRALLTGGNAAERVLGGEVAGLYWLMNVTLPGYNSFRFPAKLLHLAAAPLSLLAAAGWDQLVARTSRSAARLLRAITALSLAGLVIAWLLRPWWEGILSVRGPLQPGGLDVWGAHARLTGALLHGAVVGGLLWWLLRPRRDPAGGPSNRTGAALWIITALELGVANRPLVLFAADADLAAEPAAARVIAAAERERPGDDVGEPPAGRAFRPPAWSGLALDWKRDTLFWKFNLHAPLGMASVPDTIVLDDFEAFFDILPLTEAGVFVQPRRAADLWGVKYFIVPQLDEPRSSERTTLGLRNEWTRGADELSYLPKGPPLPPAATAGQGRLGTTPESLVLYNPSHFPRAWIVHAIEAVPPIDPQDRRRFLTTMFDLVYPQAEIRDLRQEALVEDADLAEVSNQGFVIFPQPGGVESCRVVQYAADRVEIAATLQTPGLVVLADTLYPGWELTVASNGGPAVAHPILRTNRMQRGVVLPAGDHRLSYVYRPRPFYWGALVSGSAWLALLAAAFPVLMKAARRTPSR